MSELLQGDCLIRLKELKDNSIDAIITDPPYELGFMGKKWDNSGIAYNVEMWKECLRVLKPGGYLLSFGGTRTYHRMACAIEDAGFEIRNMLEWIFASGFPKSQNIGKMYDKKMGNEREWISESPFKASEEAELATQGKSQTGRTTHPDITKGTSPYEGLGTALKPAHESICVGYKPLESSTDLMYNLDIIIKKIILCLSKSFVKIAENSSVLSQAERKEVVNIAQCIAEKNINTLDDLLEVMDMLPLELMESLNLSIVLLWLNILAEIWRLQNTSTIETELNLITELKILKSMEWENIFQSITHVNDKTSDGLNKNVYNVESIFNVVSLKLKDILTHFAGELAIYSEKIKDLPPKHEPICMARKPLSEKTVVDNVIKYGTGGINIDESRVGIDGGETHTGGFRGNNGIYGTSKEVKTDKTPQGRFPANLIHDNSEEVRECFPETKSGNLIPGHKRGDGTGNSLMGGGGIIEGTYGGDSGNASRFFKSIVYIPKASKSERNMGCDELEEKSYASKALHTPKEGSIAKYGLEEAKKKLAENSTNKNNHPTVKPIALMEYLIKMVTPKGGIVLDPFMGSGTTGIACRKLNYGFIGIELEPDYIKIAKARINSIKAVQEKLL